MEREVLYRFRVQHPELGTQNVEAPGRYYAIVQAAQKWGVRWTSIARNCTTCQMGEAPERKKRR